MNKRPTHTYHAVSRTIEMNLDQLIEEIVVQKVEEAIAAVRHQTEKFHPGNRDRADYASMAAASQLAGYAEHQKHVLIQEVARRNSLPQEEDKS